MSNEEELKPRVLYKDNTLVRTKYNLNLIENRVHNLIMYNFQNCGDNFKCTLSMEEIKKVIKKKELHNEESINKILEKLGTEWIHIEEIKADGIHKRYHKYHFINGYSYDEEFKTYTITATKEIYVLLKKKFDCGGYTNLNMNVFLSLKNYYAQRLYDLLRLWSNSKSTINYKVDDLKGYLKLEDKYSEYGNFKRRVITPAVKELNVSGVFEIEMKEKKVGRKVESIDFLVKDLDRNTSRKNKDNEPIDIDPIEVEALDIHKENEARMVEVFGPAPTDIPNNIPELKRKPVKPKKSKSSLDEILKRNKKNQI